MIMTKLTDPSTPPLEINTFGDTIVIIGPGAVRLRVISLLFRSVSKPFAATLDPAFLEGRTNDTGHPKEIALPEDDADAMGIVFNIIHGNPDRVADPLDVNMILRVSIMADKYDCVSSLKYSIESWLNLSDEHVFSVENCREI
jgi:hypothetical protein